MRNVTRFTNWTSVSFDMCASTLRIERLSSNADDKKNDPGKLIPTVSGHVASGQDYLEAAVRGTRGDWCRD